MAAVVRQAHRAGCIPPAPDPVPLPAHAPPPPAAHLPAPQSLLTFPKEQINDEVCGEEGSSPSGWQGA